MATTGQAPTDFIALAGFGPTLANMGLTGAIGTLYVLLIGGDLNGPVIGAILTIVGFAAFGKHPRNIVPIMLGVFIGSLAKPWNAADPSILLAALFGTTLAPIAGRFGWHWGIVAGIVHSSAATSVGVAARGPQPVQQRLRRRHRRGGAGAGHHRDPGRARRGPPPTPPPDPPARDASRDVPRSGLRADRSRRSSKHCRGSRKSHDTSTNGAVSAGMASGVSATLSAACATTVNTVPSAAYAATRAPGR